MRSRLYVGNLSYNTTEGALRDAFKASGDIRDLRLMTDRETGQSRGFAFVTYATPEQAQQAIQDWNGTDLDGRRLKVNEAEDRRPSDGARQAPRAPQVEVRRGHSSYERRGGRGDY